MMLQNPSRIWHHTPLLFLHWLPSVSEAVSSPGMVSSWVQSGQVASIQAVKELLAPLLTKLIAAASVFKYNNNTVAPKCAVLDGLKRSKRPSPPSTLSECWQWAVCVSCHFFAVACCYYNVKEHFMMMMKMCRVTLNIWLLGDKHNLCCSFILLTWEKWLTLPLCTYLFLMSWEMTCTCHVLVPLLKSRL